MKPIRILLCDDDERSLGLIAGVVQAAFNQAGAQADITTCTSVPELRRWMECEQFSLLMLDIDLPIMNGIAFGKELRQHNSKIDIIYVSGREDKVFDSLRVHPVGFIRKSRLLEDVPQVIQDFLHKYQEEEREKQAYLLVELRDQVRSIPISEILYIEGSRNCQLIHLAGGAEPVQVHVSLQELEQRLEKQGFLRIHKGFLVPYTVIQLIQDKSVLLTNGEQLPISRRKVQEIKQKYLTLMRTRGATLC